MRFIEDVFKANAAWAERKLSEEPGYFDRLARGQTPKMLYIGCSDSRVPVEMFVDAQPGEVFVHRNVANMVVVTDNNANAVIQYAVEQLAIRHIVVCGHYGCGGVRAALEHHDLGELNAWLQAMRDVYRLHQAELDAIPDLERRNERLVELNVLEQCFNVLKIDHVQRAFQRTEHFKVHGWVFDVRTGRLKDLDLDIEKEFARYQAIYDVGRLR